jgi:hypothetical protein
MRPEYDNENSARVERVRIVFFPGDLNLLNGVVQLPLQELRKPIGFGPIFGFDLEHKCHSLHDAPRWALMLQSTGRHSPYRDDTRRRV